MNVVLTTPQEIDEVIVNVFDRPIIIPPQPDLNLYQVKADQDVAPNPAVNRTGEISNPINFVRSKFTVKWQWFSIDLLSLSVHGVLFAALTDEDKKTMIRKWGVFTDSGRFLNNKAGTDICNNYITGEMRGSDPKIDPYICAFSTVQVLETRSSVSTIGDEVKVKKTFVMARLYAFDESETPPPVTKELLDNDRRILTATVINKDGRVDNFPQYTGMRHPYPLISARNTERWFPLIDLEKVNL